MHRFLRAMTLFAALALGPLAAAADDYRVLDGAQPGNDPDTIEVVEFFWYGCPHCYRFSPYIQDWKADKPEGVTFSHVPAIFAPSWEVHARAYYAAELLGVLDRFHQPMFRALHEQGRKLDSASKIRAFVDGLGLDGEEFASTMNSFAVDTRVRRARSLQKAYQISGTPSVVIDGKYVTSGNVAGGFGRMIEVINERVAALRGGGSG